MFDSSELFGKEKFVFDAYLDDIWEPESRKFYTNETTEELYREIRDRLIALAGRRNTPVPFELERLAKTINVAYGLILRASFDDS